MTVGSTGSGRKLDHIDCHGSSAKMSFKSGIRASMYRYLENQPMLYSYSINPVRPYWTMRVAMFKLAAFKTSPGPRMSRYSFSLGVALQLFVCTLLSFILTV